MQGKVLVNFQSFHGRDYHRRTEFPFWGQGLECLNMHFEFLSAIHCGDAIETIIECTNTDPVKNLATFKINCFKQDKEQVITGQAVMITPH